MPIQRRDIPDSAMKLELPNLPPSTNNLFFNAPHGGRVRTQSYNDWLHTAGLFLKRQIPGRLTGRVDVLIQAEDKHPRRDADNIAKPCLDLLVKLGAIQDDNSKWVKSVKVEWAPVDGLKIEIRRAA